MRCPECGGERVALAALPGEEPGELRVCLLCANLWTEEVPAEPPQPRS